MSFRWKTVTKQEDRGHSYWGGEQPLQVFQVGHSSGAVSNCAVLRNLVDLLTMYHAVLNLIVRHSYTFKSGAQSISGVSRKCDKWFNQKICMVLLFILFNCTVRYFYNFCLLGWFTCRKLSSYIASFFFLNICFFFSFWYWVCFMPHLCSEISPVFLKTPIYTTNLHQNSQGKLFLILLLFLQTFLWKISSIWFIFFSEQIRFYNLDLILLHCFPFFWNICVMHFYYILYFPYPPYHLIWECQCFGQR